MKDSPETKALKSVIAMMRRREAQELTDPDDDGDDDGGDEKHTSKPAARKRPKAFELFSLK